MCPLYSFYLHVLRALVVIRHTFDQVHKELDTPDKYTYTYSYANTDQYYGYDKFHAFRYRIAWYHVKIEGKYGNESYY